MEPILPPPAQGWPGALRRLDWRPLLIAAWGLLLLNPIRQTGYMGDDLFNASLPGLWTYAGTTPLSDAYRDARGWAAAGRINPLIHLWKEVVWLLFRDLFWYKWAQIGVVLLSLLAFYRCLRSLGAEADLAALACVLAPALFQFRECDPVLGFNFLLPGLLILTAFSLSLLQRHCRTGSRLALAGSVLLYGATLLTYEMAYPFFALHGWVLLRNRPNWKHGAWTFLLFLALPAALTLVSVYVRSRLGQAAQPYGIAFNAAGAADTFAKQFVAALPCSSAALGRTPPPCNVFTARAFCRYPAVSVVGLLVYGGLCAGSIRRVRGSAGALGMWGGFGLLLAVLPVLMLCLCARYQGVFAYGFGYLPVYFQYFGVALLLAVGVAGLGAWLRRLPVWLAAAAPALLFATFTVFHQDANAQMAAAWRVPFISPRREIEEAIDAGLIRDAAPGAMLLIDRSHHWELAGSDCYFYCCHTRTRLAGVFAPDDGADALRKVLPDRPGGPGSHDALRVRYVAPGQTGGFAIAGRVCYARLNTAGALSETGLRGVRLAVWRGDEKDPQSDRPFVFHSTCRRDGDEARPAEPVDLPSSSLRRAGATEHWAFYDIESPYPHLDGEAAWIEFPGNGEQARVPAAKAP